jgi:hypothetical protein
MYFAISTVIYNYDFCLFRTFFSFLKVFDCISCFYFENISKCFSSFSSLSFSFLYLPFLIHLSFLYRLSHSTTSFCFFFVSSTSFYEQFYLWFFTSTNFAISSFPLFFIFHFLSLNFEQQFYFTTQIATVDFVFIRKFPFCRKERFSILSVTHSFKSSL